MKAVLVILYLVCASHVLGATGHQLQVSSPGRFDSWDHHMKAMQQLNARFTDLTESESEAKTGEPIMAAIMVATAIVYGANSILSYYRKMQAAKYLEGLDQVLDQFHEERNARCVMYRGVHFQLSLYQYSLKIYMGVAKAETVFTEEMEALEDKMHDLQAKVTELLTSGIEWACRSDNQWEESVRESRAGIKADMEARAKEAKDSAVQCIVSAFSAYSAMDGGFVTEASHLVGSEKALKALGGIVLTEVGYALSDIASGSSVSDAFKARLTEDVPLIFAIKEFIESGKFESSGLGPQEVVAMAATLEYLAEKSAEFVTGVAKSAILGVVATLGLVKALKSLTGTIVGMMNDEGRYESLMAQATVNHSMFVKESNTATCQFMDNLYSITKGQNDLMNTHRKLHEAKKAADKRKAAEAEQSSWPSLSAFADAIHRGSAPPKPKPKHVVPSTSPEERRKLVSDVLTKDLFGECMRGEASLCYEALNQPIVRRALMPLMEHSGRKPYGLLTQVSARGPISDFQLSIGTSDASALRSMGYTLVSTEHLFDKKRSLLWMCRACTSRAILASSLRWYNGDGKDETVNDEEEQQALDEEKETMEQECGEKMTVLQITRGTWLRFCTVDRTQYIDNPRDGTMYSLLYDVKMTRYIYGSNVNRLLESAWRFSHYYVASAGHKEEDNFRWWSDKTFEISKAFSSAPPYKHLLMKLELEPKLYQNDPAMNQYKMDGYPVLAVKVIRGVCAHVSQLMSSGWRQEYVHEMSLEAEDFRGGEEPEERDPIQDRVEVWTLRSTNGNPDAAAFQKAKSKARWLGNSEMVSLRKKYEEFCKADDMVPIWEFLKPDEMVSEISASDWKRIRDIQVCKFNGVVCRSLQHIPGWTLAGIKDIGQDGGEKVVVEVWFNIRDSNGALARDPATNKEVADLAQARFKNWECQALKMLCNKSMCRFENKLDSSNSLMMTWKSKSTMGLRLRWAADRYGSAALLASCEVSNPDFIRIAGWNARFAREMAVNTRFARKDLSSVSYHNSALATQHKMKHLTTLHLLQETTGWATQDGNKENFANMYNKYDCRVRLFFPVMWTGWPNKENSVGRCIRKQVTIDEEGVIEEVCALESNMGSVIRDVYIVEVVFDSVDSSVYQAPTPKDLRFAEKAGWVVLPVSHRTNENWKSWNANIGELGGAIRIWVQVDEALQKTPEHEEACVHFNENCATIIENSKALTSAKFAEGARFDYSVDDIIAQLRPEPDDDAGADDDTDILGWRTMPLS